MPKKSYGDRRKPQAPERTETENRLRFEPGFLDFYNELVRPNVELRVPAYIWKWKASLSKGAFVTYLRLRSMCYYDLRNKDNTRDWCWPKQTTLAKELGVSTRSLSDYLKELEKLNLIRRKANYEYDAKIRKRKRVEDTYVVPWELPLVPEDLARYASHYAGELIGQVSQDEENQQDRPIGKNCTQVEADSDGTYRQKLQADVSTHTHNVDNSGPIGKNCSASSSAKTAEQESVPEELIPNVQRLANKSSGKRKPNLFDNPKVSAMTSAEIEGKERLAYEIGEKLKVMSGNRSTDAHPYARFHFKLACLLPEEVLRLALVATRDAMDSRKTSEPSKYFFGIVRNQAETLGVDL